MVVVSVAPECDMGAMLMLVVVVVVVVGPGVGIVLGPPNEQ